MVGDRPASDAENGTKIALLVEMYKNLPLVANYLSHVLYG